MEPKKYDTCKDENTMNELKKNIDNKKYHNIINALKENINITNILKSNTSKIIDSIRICEAIYSRVDDEVMKYVIFRIDFIESVIEVRCMYTGDFAEHSISHKYDNSFSFGETNLTILSNDCNELVYFKDIQTDFISSIKSIDVTNSLELFSKFINISVHDMLKLFTFIFDEIGVEYKTQFEWLSYVVCVDDKKL